MDQKIEKNIKEYLSNLPGLITAYLFGSFASGEDNEKSDIDIALLFDDHLKYNPDKLSIMTDLSRIVDRDVDIVIINYTTPRMFHEILMNCVILVDRNPSQRINREVLNKKLYEDYRYLHSIYMKGLAKRYGKPKHR